MFSLKLALSVCVFFVIEIDSAPKPEPKPEPKPKPFQWWGGGYPPAYPPTYPLAYGGYRRAGMDYYAIHNHLLYFELQ